MKYQSIVYLGLKVNEEDPDHVVNHLISHCLGKLSQKFKEISLDAEQFKSFEEHGWKRPLPPYHITSLFVNRKAENRDKEEFKKFREDIPEQIAVKGFVLVEDYLMVAILCPQTVPVENKVPHMTLLLKEGKAFDSNMVLEKLATRKLKGPKDLADEVFKQHLKGKLTFKN